MGRGRVLHRGPQRRTDLRLADHPIAAQYRHASGDVFKLADIAWPVVRFEQHDRGGVELLAGQPRLGGAIEEVSCEQSDVLTPFAQRSEEHTSELQSLMRLSYAVFCLKKKNKTKS